jgi:hypothetical protein
VSRSVQNPIFLSFSWLFTSIVKRCTNEEKRGKNSGENEVLYRNVYAYIRLVSGNNNNYCVFELRQSLAQHLRIELLVSTAIQLIAFRLLLSRPFVRSFFIFTNYIRLNNKVKKDIFTYRNIKNVCSERSGAGAGT